uniref:Glutaredoxin domain-containing protein n=1 Tax=Heterorhabditis bacteriophora TaxID=37862 RepID=A0A1I7XS38_HETBA
MSKHLYKQYAQLIAKWPRDLNKNPERDLSIILKSELERQFKQDRSPFLREPGLCEKRLKALEQIFSNDTASLYSHNYRSGIFGLNLEQLQSKSPNPLTEQDSVTSSVSRLLTAISSTFCGTTSAELLHTKELNVFTTNKESGGQVENVKELDGKDEVKNALRQVAAAKLVVVYSGNEISLKRFYLLMKNSVQAVGTVDITPVRVSEQAKKCIQDLTLLTQWPLVYVKGDPVGGLDELQKLASSGILAEWLKDHKYDLIVIGGGSGGLAAAKEAARLGKKVACLDYVKPSPQGSTWGLGGTCVNVGCIPKKLMHRASMLGHSIKDAKMFGWRIPEGEISHNWTSLRNSIQDHIASLNWGYRVQLREKMVGLHVCILQSFINIISVMICSRCRILLKRPYVLALPMFLWNVLVFSEVLDMMLRGVPLRIEEIEPKSMEKAGVLRVFWEKTLADGSKIETSEEYNTVKLKLQYLLTCIQIHSLLKGRREQSISCPYVYSIGDVLENTPELTPVAIQAGRVLMRRLYMGTDEVTEYDAVPTTVFTPLEYGSCGLSEELAHSRYGRENVVVYHAVFLPLEYTVAERMDKDHCYCKLICLKSEDVGYHILSPWAGEVTQGFAISLKMACTKRDFDRLIGIHPTVAENFTTLTLVKKEGDEELKANDFEPTEKRVMMETLAVGFLGMLIESLHTQASLIPPGVKFIVDLEVQAMDAIKATLGAQVLGSNYTFILMDLSDFPLFSNFLC